MPITRFLTILICLGAFGNTYTFAQNDSLKKIKIPKHYFTPTLFTDFYTTPEKNIRTTEWNGKPLPAEPLRIAKVLKNYAYSQSIGGFYFPILTREKVHEDLSVSNFHFLGTGCYMLSMPRFGGINNHNLLKASLGLRGIYNNGKKGIWFMEASPYLSADLSQGQTYNYRWAGTILYDYMANPALSFRFGVTRTFIYGNLSHLPYIGIRIGRLDRSYLSIQFPRNISFSFPMGRTWRGSILTKPMGGLFTMANTDSLYNGSDKTIMYGRFEMITGFRLDAAFNNHLSAFASAGVTGIKNLGFYSFGYNNLQPNKGLQGYVPFFAQRLTGGVFLEFGLTLRIGQARSVYKNYNMYEVFNTNSNLDPGDNNTNTGDANIPNDVKKKAISNLKTKDIQDLIEAQDMY